MTSDRDFKVFIDLMLTEMGYLNEIGQFEIPEEEKQEW